MLDERGRKLEKVGDPIPTHGNKQACLCQHERERRGRKRKNVPDGVPPT